jgi:hypothetical protein
VAVACIHGFAMEMRLIYGLHIYDVAVSATRQPRRVFTTMSCAWFMNCVCDTTNGWETNNVVCMVLVVPNRESWLI